MKKYFTYSQNSTRHTAFPSSKEKDNLDFCRQLDNTIIITLNTYSTTHKGNSNINVLSQKKTKT